MKRWQLQDAKNKFSEVVESAISDGPQIITRRGRETVAIISIKEYRGLTAPESDIVDFFRNSPLAGISLDLERRNDLSREIDV